ncbi:hypothetical protein M947_01505 [Sulfurimonas hongkongensis]|uniref:Uncharacterized protein n=1 Tax=Sulfurimonas hongkongensis TaxID=1172190 RepID=T0JTX9_9BACT|nr:hypothetical protein [Sulfurimonas hongkongensis]EQB40502.1 hypothetical protein M947_01505 [Sulfurimonas hongkongensis]
MRSFILSLFTLFIFNGCFTSSLSLKNENELVLKHDESELILSNEIVSSELLNFKDLYVSRYKLQDKNTRTLFYEVANTNMNFEFNYGGLYTVMYVFDNSQKYESVCEKNNLYLVQIKLKDASYLNVIIQASDSQLYTFTYGFSNEEFLKIANGLIEEENLKIKELKYDAITFNPSDSPASNWSDVIVFFTPLITPYRALNSK